MTVHRSQLRQRLAHRTGLAPTLLEQEPVSRFVEHRCRQLGLPDEAAYWKLVETSNEELDRLVQEIAVSETWLFRYPASFELLIEHLRKSRTLSDPATPLRMLSVACATGEEPYSMAIAAVTAGWPLTQIGVDGVDRHEPSLAIARRGHFKRRALRDAPPRWAEPWLVMHESTLQIDAQIMRAVEFVCGDVLSEQFMPPQRNYDVVFCRNLLIYLNPRARQRLAARLATWLRPGALLFVGHAEHASLLRSGFVGHSVPQAFALYASAPATTAQPVPSHHPAPRPTRKGVGIQLGAAQLNPDPFSRKPTTTTSPPACTLDQAQALADRGELDQALATLQVLAQQDATDPKIHELLGNVQLGRQQMDEARAAFEKVLYLDPDHHESLLHLAWICERQADTRGAARYRQRAARARNRQQQRTGDDGE